MGKSVRVLRLMTGIKAMLLLMGVVGYQHLAAAPSGEVQTLIVAYINNFMKLSEWPTTIADNQQLTLCYTEGVEFAKEFDSLEGTEIQSHNVKIKRLIQGDNADECQLLYLPDNEKPVRLQSWLNQIKDMPVLTVSNLDGFLDQGGMIALIEDSGRLQFEVNLLRVEHVKIKLSSKMLQIARDVRKE